MNWKWFLFSFEGRINRKPFWLFSLSVFVLYIITRLIYFGKIAIKQDTFTIVFSMIFVWPSLAVMAKRWHDRNKSGQWLLVSAIPLIGAFWTIIELGLLEGTVGENRFGKDPLDGAERRYKFSGELSWNQNCWAFGFLFVFFVSVFAWAVIQVFNK